MMLGARTAMWSGGAKAKYKRVVSWVSFTGDFDTGIVGIIPVKARLKFDTPSKKLATNVVAVPGWVGSYPRFAILYIDNGGRFAIGRGTQYYSSSIILRLNVVYDVTSEFSGVGSELSVDGELVLTSANSQTPTTTGNINIVGNANVRIREFDLYVSGNKVRSFIPVLDENDIPCLYDAVMDECVYGGGTASYGDDI